MSNDIKRAKRSTITHIVILIASICSIAGKGLLDIPQLLGSRTGMPNLSFWIVLVVLTVIVWIVLFFLYSKEMPKWVRRFALFSVIGIPIATGVFIVKTFFPPSKINILVAEFDGPEPQTYRVTEIIINQLRKATGAHEDVQVKALHETITEQEGSDAARTTGSQNEAAIVLWGWYSKTTEKAIVTIHFEILRHLPYLSLRHESQILKVAVQQLESFQIQEQLSNDMSCLTLLAIGHISLHQQEYDRSIESLTAALKYQPQEGIVSPYIVYWSRGVAYLRKGDYDLAFKEFNQVIELNPQFAEAYNNRGIVYDERGEYERAIEDFNQAIELEPEFADAYSNRGITYGNVGNHDLAIKDLSQVIKLKPEVAEIYYNLGVVYGNKSDYDHAIENYSKAIKLKRRFAEAYNNRGLAYHDKGDYDRAIKDYSRTIKIEPKFVAETYVSRGTAYDAKGIHERAMKDLNKAIELNPELAEAYYNRGVLYSREGEENRAMEDYNQAIRLKPGYAEAYTNRGALHGKKGNHNRALQDLNTAIELNPKLAKAYYNRGVTYGIKGDHDRAIKDFSQAIELDPEHAEAYYNRSVARRQKGDYNGAMEDYEQAKKLKPDTYGVDS